MTDKSMQEIEFEIIADIRSRVESPLMIDLGCGVTPLADGFTGADYYATGEQIERVDLFSTPWPYKSESVDLFVTSHFLEHVPGWDCHFAEIYRCLKPGGHYRVIGPYAKSDRALQDPDHKQWLLEARLLYLRQDFLGINNLRESYEVRRGRINFSIVAMGYWWHEDFEHKDEAAKRWALTHYWNAANDIQFILRKEPLLTEG